MKRKSSWILFIENLQGRVRQSAESVIQTGSSEEGTIDVKAELWAIQSVTFQCF